MIKYSQVMTKVSFAALAEQPMIDGRIPITCELTPPPSVDAEQAMLNASGLQRLGRVAGFSSITIAADTNEQVSFSAANMRIGGVNADGTAVGSVAGQVTQVRERNVEHDESGLFWDVQHGYMGQFWRPGVRLGIERAALGSNIADRRRKGATFEKAWAAEVDEQIRRCMIQAAGQALVAKTAKAGLGFAAGLSLLATRWPVTALEIAATAQALCLLPAFFSEDKYRRLRDFKPGLLPLGFQPDRAAITAVLAAATPIVTVSKK